MSTPSPLITCESLAADNLAFVASHPAPAPGRLSRYMGFATLDGGLWLGLGLFAVLATAGLVIIALSCSLSS